MKCSCQSLQGRHRSTGSEGQTATDSIQKACGLQHSTDFNQLWNLLREQGVVGSNPIAPTISLLSVAIEALFQDDLGGPVFRSHDRGKSVAGFQFGSPLDSFT